jgi:hypothetical protein
MIYSSEQVILPFVLDLMHITIHSIPIDILSIWFDKLTHISCKQSFVNFWIACVSNQDLRANLHQALLNVKEIDGTCDNRKIKRKYSVLPYLTHFVARIPRKSIAQIKETMTYIANIRDECMRISSLSITSENEFAENDIKIFSEIVKEILGLCNLEELTFPKQLKHPLSVFKNFSKLHTLEANVFLTETAIPLLDLQTLRTQSDIDFNTYVPNLVSLHITCSPRIFLENATQKIDLFSLTFLENLTAKLDQTLFYPDSEAKWDILVSGLNLKTVKIVSIVSLMSSLSSYPNLKCLHILQHFSIPQKKFQSNDIWNKAPLLSELVLDKDLVKEFASQVQKISKITSLSINNFSGDSLLPNQVQTKFGPLLLLKLTKLCFKQVTIESNQYDDILYLTSMSSLAQLEWIDIKVKSLANDGKKVVIGFAPRISDKLQSLKAEIFSSDWMNLIPNLVQIENLDLTICNHYISIDRKDLQMADLFMLAPFISVMPVNPDEFIAMFHVARLCEVNKLMASLDYKGKICRKLNLKEFHKKFNFENDLNKKPVAKTTRQQILENHNKVLDSSYNHVLECLHTHNCHFPMHGNLKLLFNFSFEY